MTRLILAAIVLTLLWHARRKPAPSIEAARLRSARLALIKTGYFKPHEVGPDVAPRITELYAALSSEDDGLLPVDPYTWTLA